MRLGGVARRHHVRWQILQQDRAHRGDAVGADTAELVHHRESAEDRMIADMHVPCELRIIGENRVMTDLAVMGKVHIRHDPVVVTDSGDTDILRGTAIQGAELADGVVVADFQPGRLAGIFFVLRRRADGTKLVNHIARADPGVLADHHMRADACGSADFDICADDGIRTDRDIGGQPCLRVDNGSGMNECSHDKPQAASPGRSRTVHINSASAAITSPTRASAANFQMPRTCRVSETCRCSASPAVTGRLKRALSMPTK